MHIYCPLALITSVSVYLTQKSMQTNITLYSVSTSVSMTWG